MKNFFYTFFAVAILISSVVTLAIVLDKSKETYLVEIEFCDQREPVQIIVRSNGAPDNYSINNFRTAVPEYCGYMNVCTIKTIKQL